MTTYRERRLARAEKLDQWAASRAAKAAADYAAARAIADQIPFGQPILVGHHSERRHRNDIARIQNGFGRSFESSDKAEAMASRADTIRAQAETAIYDDDPDAIERLTAKIAALEAKREEMKAANAAFRKTNRETLRAMTAYERGQAVPFPSYSITNLTGNIGRCKERLARLQRVAKTGPQDRMITARFNSECETCGAPLTKGTLIRYNRQNGARCATCPTESEQA